MANEYSPVWFNTFLSAYDPARTEAEVAFLERQFPQPDYQTVLDVCCGPGRHAIPLAQRGYRITGVDRDAASLAAGRQAAGRLPAIFVQANMRELAGVPGPFDAVTCLWQSFGYFDASVNAAVLRQMAARLRPGGRLILEIYNRAFYAAHKGERSIERDGRIINEVSRLDGDRLVVTLDYGSGTPRDRFEWQLYTPKEITALAASLGLRLLLACTGFDEARPATATEARMQVVFEQQMPA